MANPKVFVSYSSQNEGTVKQVRQFVELILKGSYGMKPGEDYYFVGDYNSGPSVGESWENDFIENVIGSKVVVAFIDETYFCSKNCETEWNLARGVKGRLFPVLVSGTYNDLPEDKRKTQILKAESRETWDRLVSKLAQLDFQCPLSSIGSGIEEWLGYFSGNSNTVSGRSSSSGVGAGDSDRRLHNEGDLPDINKIKVILGDLCFEDRELARDFGGSLCGATYNWKAIPRVLMQALFQVSYNIDSSNGWNPRNEDLKRAYEEFKEAIEEFLSLTSIELFYGESGSDISVKQALRGAFDRHPSLRCLRDQQKGRKIYCEKMYYEIADVDESRESELIYELGSKMQRLGGVYKGLWFACNGEPL